MRRENTMDKEGTEGEEWRGKDVVHWRKASDEEAVYGRWKGEGSQEDYNRTDVLISIKMG